VGEGAEVKAGDALAIIEAMKMENILRAERDGVVKKINAKPGDSLSVDAVIMEFGKNILKGIFSATSASAIVTSKPDQQTGHHVRAPAGGAVEMAEIRITFRLMP
jgi:pyruvate/2-oxoglutarate dehydrogenase complex dihydrolipoamide acyltransferase (E2) component